MVRSRKELSIFLSKLKVFEKAKPQLEQYPSDGNVAAELLWKAMLNGELEERKIIDMGCGTGILGIGALVLGAKFVEFIDIDPSVHPILEENIRFTEEYFDANLEGLWSFTKQDLLQAAPPLTAPDKDEVIILMNPPFGTRKKHADRGFLVAGFNKGSVVYTMHKTSTEGFISAFCRDENIHISWQEQSSFPLKNTMEVHRKKVERIQVTLYRLEKD